MQTYKVTDWRDGRVEILDETGDNLLGVIHFDICCSPADSIKIDCMGYTLRVDHHSIKIDLNDAIPTAKALCESARKKELQEKKEDYLQG